MRLLHGRCLFWSFVQINIGECFLTIFVLIKVLLFHKQNRMLLIHEIHNLNQAQLISIMIYTKIQHLHNINLLLKVIIEFIYNSYYIICDFILKIQNHDFNIYVFVFIVICY